MSAPALLACPHCDRPISFVTELAGRLVACPHCHLQLQMPATAPALVAKRPPAPPAPADPAPTNHTDTAIRFSFPDRPPPAMSERRNNVAAAEPAWYGRIETLARALAWVGVVGCVTAAALIFHCTIAPVFRDGASDTRVAVTGVLASAALLFGLAAAVLGCLLLRAALFALVDVARRLRSGPPGGPAAR